MDLKRSEERNKSNQVMHPRKIITLRARFAGESPDRESSSAGDREKKTRLALKQNHMKISGKRIVSTRNVAVSTLR